MSQQRSRSARRVALTAGVAAVALALGAPAGAAASRDDSTVVLAHGNPFHGKVHSRFVQCRRARKVTIYYASGSYYTSTNSLPTGLFRYATSPSTGYYYAKIDPLTTPRGRHCKGDQSPRVYFR